MFTGLLALLATCCLWGLPVVAPMVVPDASATAIVGGRFTILGVVAAVVGHRRWRSSGMPSRADWRLAQGLALQGFVGFYLLLVVGIQLAGAAPVAAVVGCTPVAYVLAGARREQQAVRPLLAPTAVMVLGLAVVHVLDLSEAGATGVLPLLAGVGCAAAATAVWIRYGLINAQHLRSRGVDRLGWTCMLGVASGIQSLPLLAHGLLSGGVGPDVARYGLVVVVLGLGSAWLGTWAWNVASVRLPEVIVGPLLVLELLATLLYVHLLAPLVLHPVELAGYGLLIAGVVGTVIVAQRRRPTDDHRSSCIAPSAGAPSPAGAALAPSA